MTTRFRHILLISMCAMLILSLSETANGIYTMQVQGNNNTDQTWTTQYCITGPSAGFECNGAFRLGPGGIGYSYLYIPNSGSFRLIARFIDGRRAGQVTCSQQFSSSYTVGAVVNLNQQGTGYSCAISIMQ